MLDRYQRKRAGEWLGRGSKAGTYNCELTSYAAPSRQGGGVVVGRPEVVRQSCELKLVYCLFILNIGILTSKPVVEN